MQVVKVGVGDEYGVYRWEIFDSKTWPPQAFQDEKPSGENGINDEVPAAELNEEAGMTYER